MSRERDERIVSLALERGLVAPEEVEACRRVPEPADGSPPPSILERLVQQGTLAPDQVVALLSAAQLPDLDRCELVEEGTPGVLGKACVVEDAQDGTRYVLTVLHPAIQRDAQLLDQLRRDAAVTATVDHPHMVRVLGMGEQLGDAFVLSEHVRGATLARLIEAKGKLETHEVVFVALACAKALDAGQAKGLLHGAIVPDNVVIAQNGTVKLAGLGLTKPPVLEVSLSRTGEGVRTPHGLSPEHLDRAPLLDIRSDLFSLGALLFLALTGEHPFEGDTTAEVTFAIRDGDFRRVRDVAPDAPAGLAAIIEKLLQADPARRYQTAGELVADIEALQAGKVPDALRAALAEAREAKASKPEPAPTVEAPPPRRRWLWAVAAAAAVLLLAGGVWRLTRPKAEKPPVEDDQPVPDPDDPVLRARKGRDEIQAVLADDTHETVAEPDKKIAAIRGTIEKLESIKDKYKGTDAAAEAAKRLIPLQAEALFQAAALYAREHPKQTEAIVSRYRAVVDKYPETAAALKAENGLDALEGVDRKKVQQALLASRERADKLAEAERFGDALKEWDKLLTAAASETVRQQILQEKIAITTKAERAYEQAHELAQEKVRGRLFEQARALYARVADRFGVEPYVGRAKGEIAIIEPLLGSAARRRVEAIDAAKYDFFLSRLAPSLELARGWRLAESRQEAETLRPDLRTAQIEGYLDDYLSDLALLESLKAQAIHRLRDPARPVIGEQFSLGKIGKRFDPQWLKARVLSADARDVVLRYGKVDVRRTWDQFPADELYKLGKLAVDVRNPHSRLLLGVHCLYAGLAKTATAELTAAKAGRIDVAPYLQRLEHLRPEPDERRKPTETEQEEASRLLTEAKRFMDQREWDRALWRLALLRDRHAKTTYDVSANLDDILRRIAECKPHVARLEMESDLAVGRRVLLTRDALFEEWQKRFGAWTITDGLVRGEMAVDPKAKGEGGGDHDAECLYSLAHPPSYELRVKVRVLKGTGALIRLAGKARPNLGFWIHAQDPKLVGILHAYKGDEKPAEHTKRPYPVKLNQWVEIRAIVSPASVEAAIGADYAVRIRNPLTPDPKGIVTYGFLVNPNSAAEFRDFSVRVLQEQ